MLATFQKEVMGFLEDGERSMLGEAEADLRWKEERRAKLAQCKQNLENVPSTDTIYFLQVGWQGEGDSVVLWGFVPFPMELGARNPGMCRLQSHSCWHSPLPSPRGQPGFSPPSPPPLSCV